MLYSSSGLTLVTLHKTTLTVRGELENTFNWEGRGHLITFHCLVRGLENAQFADPMVRVGVLPSMAPRGLQPTNFELTRKAQERFLYTIWCRVYRRRKLKL